MQLSIDPSASTGEDSSLRRSDLLDSVSSIFTSMLRLEVQPSHAVGFGPGGGHRLTASVALTGDFSGMVIFECSAETACMIAGAMLQMEFQRVDEDVQDVLGEIANMIAGNINRLLPGSSALSLPHVIQGNDYSLGIPHAEEILRQHMLCKGKPLNVSVVRAAR